MNDVARPAWPDAPRAATPAHDRRTIDLKLVIAVLIGLVSVTGAALTWRSSLLSEQATDKDRQAVAETVRVQQDAADDEITVQDARSRVASHAAALAAATVLDEQAQRFEAAGDPDSARVAADEAVEQRAIAARYLQSGTTALALVDYVVEGSQPGRLVLDAGRLRDDLASLSRAASRVDPSQTVREANRLRSDSQRLDGFLIPLVLAIVLLTLAQISRRRPLPLVLTGVATCVWIVSAVIAFTGT